MNQDKDSTETAHIVPSGRLLKLKPERIKPSRNNPRILFDPKPLKVLKENIKQHGVLVPITVYQLTGQDRYEILDGARRHHCCVELKKEGIEIEIPANVVQPPDKIAGLLYMFSIHNFRQAWELMPTALSLQIVMKELGEQENEKLSKLTGLSVPQIERCKKLLAFPKRFQELSLDADPKIRIPANFWIEALPILELCERTLPGLIEQYSRDGITDRLVEKYRAKKIKSVIHFRRIMDAYETADRKAVIKRLRDWIDNINLDTRKAFDEFVVDTRRITGAIKTSNDFVKQLRKAKLDFTSGKNERAKLRKALIEVRDFVDGLLNKLEGKDAPPENNEGE
jgi:ParB/RepB/Spo0J family partition protein